MAELVAFALLVTVLVVALSLLPEAADRALAKYSVEKLARRDAEEQSGRELAQAELDARSAANIAAHNAVDPRARGTSRRARSPSSTASA